MNPIASASSIPSLDSISSLGNNKGATRSNGEGGFSKLVDSFVQQTNENQMISDQAIDDLVQGKTDNVHQVVLAVANAEMSFQLFMEIRNKLIDSYNDLMRMQF
ncbi:MAG: flagellar hook-basal body complex protein FliE [Mariniblastus sp.]|jgi:flagellar hook-basal body complex protein FliE|nr:flagellar hook-basal body complex protein FliE [Planctomycetaceae bacterium]MCP4477011.1 flagellar hook-basal body complex protein FliE [Planctomycetaceae bacterium]MCP4773792.1 flagellar hook-basal body complex protein FliE [Planctomycetaceae bacterium]MDG1512210.1 flagellar hook-basal body complex protein FliE [Mariniblastus sp.]MDG2180179.1 flagellar hook-basal body complex protein FliE [Mariniblastus sp.]